MSEIVVTLWESSLKGVVREAKFTRLCFGRMYVYVLTHACVRARVPNEDPLAHGLEREFVA